MGEDIGALGGVYRVTDGLIAEFGVDRVVDTPLAESGIIGTAIGLSLRGYQPVCEIQFDGFVFPGLQPDHHPAGEDALAQQRQPDRSRRHPHPVRRRHRLDRAPLGIAGSTVRPHGRPAHHHAVQPARRLLDDPAGRRLPGPRDRLRAQAPLLAQGRRRHREPRCVRRPVQGARAPRGNRRHRRGLRARWCPWPSPRPKPPPRTATASK